jgi:hypothetical protein
MHKSSLPEAGGDDSWVDPIVVVPKKLSMTGATSTSKLKMLPGGMNMPVQLRIPGTHSIWTCHELTDVPFSSLEVTLNLDPGGVVAILYVFWTGRMLMTLSAAITLVGVMIGIIEVIRIAKTSETKAIFPVFAKFINFHLAQVFHSNVYLSLTVKKKA